jgi:hypothetical protein
VELTPRDWLAAHIDNPPDTDQCIIWPFSRAGRHGGAAYGGTTVGRVLLGLEHGDGLVARHTCHNAPCVNVRHLIPGTPADNSRDMVEAGRSLIGDRNPNWVDGRSAA